MPDDERDDRPESAVAVVRRAPFSDNPQVGARGQRAQQRILDAALRAFGEDGYHGCSIDRITKLARCSRVSFYQYFANKEDVFRQLAGQVARQVGASTEALDPLTADPQGWIAMRAWVARYTAIYTRYEPVFHSLQGDAALATVAQHTGEETITRIHARLVTATLPPRQLDPAIRLLLECLNHTLDVTSILRSSAPRAYPTERVEIAITDVLHRTLFGMRTDVNVHAATGPAPPAIEFGPEMLALLQRDGSDDPDLSGNPALLALVEAGRDVFIERGYQTTRVDDLVSAAGVSHGAFYRYFRNKEELARILTVRAVRSVGAAVTEIPDVSTLCGPTGKSVLRRWLRRYHAAHVHEAAMLRVWIDAALPDSAIRAESAPLLDWGRHRMSRYLRDRGFGDIEAEAVVMVALLGVFGARRRSPAEVDAVALIIERGLLGVEPSEGDTSE
jgi:AcrR family transcriptional regulator